MPLIRRGSIKVATIRFSSMNNRHPNLIKIGQLIRNKRQECGYSQEAFAAEAKLGRTYFGRVERGEQNISIQNLIRIALTLGVELSELLPSKRQLKMPNDHLRD